ncbi:Transferase [Parasponia andersonii]|uniref:Transferase n=1 Tax=Parasponia andersonii TaxID=3476 RepID=A0A2P5C9S9_PARAD|nr:Transferase [Parasponia andersonii]
MAEEKMKIEIIRTETIKPSSLTPLHLKMYKLSFLDQLSPPIYGRVIYFYPQSDAARVPEQRTQKLKKSLSESLSCFYPMAGRINDNTFVECSDEGAPFVEARCNGLLSTFLQNPADLSLLQLLLPTKVESPEAGTWPLMQVQATFFDRGELAVGISTSHKLTDAASMALLMTSWAKTSIGSDQTVVPVFDAASYFPQRDLSHFKLPPMEMNKLECVTKRFVFDKSRVVDLKAKAASGDAKPPTRSQAVTALISKCVMAASRSNSGVAKKFFLTQAMSLRKRAEPPLPENLFGNVLTFVSVEVNENHEAELKTLVADLRKGIEDFTVNKAIKLREDDASEVIFQDLKEAGELMGRDDRDGLIVSSFCNFQLYETVDFGWGKPIWVTIPVSTGRSNFLTLMDTKEGGVEAWVTLNKNDMALFESDPELLEFAYPSTQISIV